MLSDQTIQRLRAVVASIIANEKKIVNLVKTGGALETPTPEWAEFSDA